MHRPIRMNIELVETSWPLAEGSGVSTRNFLEATPVYSSSPARFAASHSGSAVISRDVRIDDPFTCS